MANCKRCKRVAPAYCRSCTTDMILEAQGVNGLAAMGVALARAVRRFGGGMPDLSDWQELDKQARAILQRAGEAS